MCGISGFIDFTLDKEEAVKCIFHMIQAQHHRGPDDRGYANPAPGVWLGHNRLAIIDLSSDGRQPMSRAHFTITFNGEIYNYLEIKQELLSHGYKFTTSSDTEVILLSYAHWGERCVEKFRGMWAFAIWDNQLQKLFCSRDRFGIKPFHFIAIKNILYFASEIKALKISRIFSDEINQHQLMRDVQLGWSVYSDETHYKVIKQLKPGHNLVYSQEGINIYSYYTLQKKEFGVSEATELFRQYFFESIRLHMRADVEIGSTFSGGLDSSAVVCAVHYLYQPKGFKTFTVWYEEADERVHASKVWQAYPSIIPYTLKPDGEEIVHAFVQASHQYDAPVSGSSYLSQYFVMRLAHQKGIKVLLDGQGSDEYLMGYPHSLYRYFATILRDYRFDQFISEIEKFRKTQGWGMAKILDLLVKTVLSRVMSEQTLYTLEYKHFYPNAFGKHLKTNFNMSSSDAEPLRNFSWHLLYTTILQTLLLHEDRNSMAFSIEARVPFLDHKLVELVYSLPADFKIRDGYTKYILRKALADIMPPEITWRADKMGFVTPGEIKWLRNQLIWLLNEPMNIPQIDQKIWRKEKKKFLQGHNHHARWIWRVASANYWYTYCRKPAVV
jgi:asparagine synthase (glutamine-hydrolysing)